MIHGLGTRGRAATLAAACTALLAAAYSVYQQGYVEAVTLVMLAYLSVLVGGVWGVNRSVLRTTTEIADRQKAISTQERKQIGAIKTKVDRIRSQVNGIGSPSANGTVGNGTPKTDQSVIRRYAGLVDQPTSVPNSSLLAFLEILAKDATTRRADDAVTRQAIGELRDMVHLQHEEIVALHQRLTEVESMEPAGSSR